MTRTAMFLPDTSVVTDDTTTQVIEDLDQVLGAIGHAFWMSLAILVVIYLLKYFAGRECVKKDFIEILLEIPIDVLTLLLTIIITTFCTKNRMHFGHYLFIITIVVSIVCALLRRKALNAYYVDNKGKLVFLLIVSELTLGGGWITYIYLTIA